MCVSPVGGKSGVCGVPALWNPLPEVVPRPNRCATGRVDGRMLSTRGCGQVVEQLRVLDSHFMDNSFETAIREWARIADTLRGYADSTQSLQGIAWHSTSAEAFRRDVEARAGDFRVAANMAERVGRAFLAHGRSVEDTMQAVFGR